jgi:hypothetical protein
MVQIPYTAFHANYRHEVIHAPKYGHYLADFQKTHACWIKFSYKKNSYTEVHGSTTNGLVADTRLKTDGCVHITRTTGMKTSRGTLPEPCNVQWHNTS